MRVAMKKATVAFLSDKLEAVTEALQRCGEFMPIRQESSVNVRAVSAPILYEEADTALKAYSRYTKSSGGMLSAPTLYTEQEFDRDSQQDKTHVIKTVELYEQLGSVEAQIRQCDEDYAELLPYEGLELDAEEQNGTKYTSLIIGSIPYSAKPKDAQPLDTVCEKYGISYCVFYEKSGLKYFYTSVFKDDEKQVTDELEQYGFEKLRLPYKTGTAKEAIEKNRQKKQQLEFLRESTEKELTEAAEKKKSVELFFDKEKAKTDRAEIPAELTESTVVLTGWVRSDKMKTVEKAVSDAAGICSVSFEDPAEDDEVPSVTKDPYLIDQYSTITNSYSPPGKDDIDPNPFMAPWYFMIFGMIIGDVGYGILIGLVMLAVKKIKRPTGDFARLVNVMMYSSIPGVFWGVMYGSYFGAEWFPPVLFSPLKNILGAMLLALGVGVLHMFTGITIKAVMNIKAGKVLDAITDQIAWMTLITGCGLLALAQTRTAGIIMIIASLAVIIILGGHAKKTVFGKITGGVTSLTGITNYMSDILSYLRIFALALASGLIGMVMNVVAGMITSGIPVPVLNFIAAVPVYALGHGLNTALSILGAYVHTGRLQFIEFFGKFYEGNGMYFRPMQRKNKYTQIVNNKKAERN